MFKLIALMLFSLTVNAELYSDCPDKNCTLYSSGGVQIPPPRVTTPTAVPSQPNCGSSETYIRVTEPVDVVRDAESFKLDLKYIRYENVIFYNNKVTLYANGFWTLNRLNGVELSQ